MVQYGVSKVYPRVCGGTTIRPIRQLSPRVRGNPTPAPLPACGGVYPRVCGGTPPRAWCRGVKRGLSPRVRGNQCPPLAPRLRTRSIPACAGEPGATRRLSARWEVYPRVCGGTRSCSSPCTPSPGLSPRVRGNHHGQLADEAAQGSIPACAGEPSGGICAVVICAVYPRVCGGTRAKVRPAFNRISLSPRVRGNPVAQSGLYHPEPVYPRVCGGTIRGPDGNGWWLGLSPRVRGNRAGSVRSSGSARSIPACAGEPRLQSRRQIAGGVYPRVCGGTLAVIPTHPQGGRSIPACAGEPAAARCMAN